MATENKDAKPGLFGKIWNVVKTVVQTGWNFIKGLFMNIPTAIVTVVLTGTVIVANFFIPGITMIFLGLVISFMFCAYLGLKLVSAYIAARKQISVTQATANMKADAADAVQAAGTVLNEVMNGVEA